MSSKSSISDSEIVPSVTIKKKNLNFVFDPNDEFYLASPAAKLLHYRTAAIIAGLLEVLTLICSVFTILHFHLTIGLTGFKTSLMCISFLIIASLTTTIMIIGILKENAKLMLPQIYFFKVEIITLLIGATFSIASMSLGMYWSRTIFSPIVNVPLMEDNLGPIWPFNLATASFCGAALGIWFHEIVDGCYDYLLDKKYFENIEKNQIELQNKSTKQ